MIRLCDLEWKEYTASHSWHIAILPGNVHIYRAKPEHPTMAGLYQFGYQQSPFPTPRSGRCWDELTTQCWLIEYMRWWEKTHGVDKGSAVGKQHRRR